MGVQYPLNSSSLNLRNPTLLSSSLPPPQVCECVVILRNLKDVSWAGAKSMMAEGNFLKSLQEFDKDAVGSKQVKQVKEYMKVRGGEEGSLCTNAADRPPPRAPPRTHETPPPPP